LELIVASRRPSPRHGWTEAIRLWRVVLAIWAVAWAAIAPALLIMRLGVFPALAELPPEPAAVAPGDVGLILAEAARPMLVPFALAVVSGLAVIWGWTVLWHSGVVAWRLWTGGRRVRLGEVLGLGMVSWWRYARLSATAAAALLVAGAAVWLPLASLVDTRLRLVSEQRTLAILLAGAAITKLLAILVWLATLQGAWVLGLPERRSAVMAWLRGLANTLRTPLSSVGTWLVWVLPACAATAVSLWIGVRFPGLRGTPLLIAVSLSTALIRTFCWVGLFCSFAPVTGLIGNGDGDPADERVTRQVTGDE
jgi:hypothetical protein